VYASSKRVLSLVVRHSELVINKTSLHLLLQTDNGFVVDGIKCSTKIELH